MKEIPLSRGLVAKVDDADYDWLMQWKWSAIKVGRAGELPNYYAARKGGTILMHREIMAASKGQIVDHENHDTLYNLRGNLRLSVQAKNTLNTRPRKNKKSRFKGVRAARKKWEAVFMGRRLGCFATEIGAAQAYDAAAMAHDAEFCLTNFLPDGSERDFPRPMYGDVEANKCSSKYLGVAWVNRDKSWRVKVNGKQIAQVRDEEKAARIYADAVGLSLIHI